MPFAPLPPCHTCQFWIYDPLNLQGIGECRRYPTSVPKSRYEGCGEHRSIESNDSIPYGRMTDTAQTDTPQA